MHELTVSHAAVLQAGRSLEGAPPSERAIVDRCDDGGQSVRDGIRVDEEWEHHRFPEGQRRRPIGTSMSYLALLFARH